MEAKLISNTAETLNNLKTFREDVKEKLENREILEFNISSIDIDGEKMTYNNEELSDEAMKKVLGHLRVKNNFLEMSKHMTTTDWNTVKDKLKSARGSQLIYGRKVKSNGSSRIDDIFMAAPRTNGLLEVDSIFNEVLDSIVSTGKDITLKGTCFLEDKDEITITLLEHDNPVDIFSNEEDIWKVGKRIVWNGMQFSISPFFERLVCSNGNTAPQFGFKANISNNKFNLGKIKKILEKEITLQSDTMDNYLIDSVNHLKHHNISVKEFMKFRSFFNEESHPEIIKKWLDDSYLNKAYGCIVAEMPDLWMTTADAGKNAYSFFNDLTYIASHPDEATLTDRERVDLQIKASDLLFKKRLDMEQIAPKVKWS